TTIMATLTTELGRRSGRLTRVAPGVRASGRLAPVARSARGRILGWYVILLAVAIGASLLVERQLLMHRLDTRVDSQLSVEASALNQQADTQQTAGPGSVRGLFDSFLRSHVAGPDGEFLTLVGGRPFEASFGGPYPLERIPGLVGAVDHVRAATWGTIDSASGPVRYVAVPVQQPGSPPGTFVAADFVRPAVDEVTGDVAVAAAVSLTMLLVMSLIAWLVAGRVLAPVRLMTDAARSISETDLARRIRAGADDEIGGLARTFNAMLDRLQAAFVSQRDFVSDAGHELRTPITVIRGHLELLGDDPQERAETMTIVNDELDRMTRMVDDLLLLAKAERPGFLHLAPAAVDEMVRDLMPKVAALGARRWECQVSGSVTSMADHQRLTQALMNLAANAVAHTGEAGRITIGLDAARESYRLWVSDDGIGIAPDDQTRVFERFARGRNGRRRSQGAGLGLSIVRAIAEAHHGRVELISSPGRGSTFTLVLPIQNPQEGAWQES
ncbi:MAG TPA: HAMP domain-containing sensor histidine kinase, partial [Acidimicrobiales bacterium]|nr:HAMP domain-containing sensor histidine kinase [Acidimicrobiales bacterium]